MDRRLDEASGAYRAKPLLAYYSNILGSQAGSLIRNFDIEPEFERCCNKVADNKSHNFMIDFGKDYAYCGFDLEAEVIGKLLNAEVGHSTT